MGGEAAAMQRRKVDNRLRVLIENGVAERQRALFVVVGDHGKDQVSPAGDGAGRGCGERQGPDGCGKAKVLEMISENWLSNVCLRSL